MPLKPSSICQLSLLSLSMCVSLQSQGGATELSLQTTHTFSQADLIVQDSLLGPTTLTPAWQDEPLQSIPVEAERPNAVLYPHSPLPSGVNEVDTDQYLAISSEDANGPVIPSGKPAIPHEPARQLSKSDLDRVSLTTTLPPQPTLTIDQIVQVPDGPVQEESAGRRPSIRTQPTTPEEVPLDLREDLLTPKIIYSPSTTILTPSAYGKSWRQASVGFGFQHRTRFTDLVDGAFGVGIGFGDARKYVGLDVGLTMTDLDNFERGIISFKLHRRLPNLFAVAVGVNDAISWGPGDIDGPSPYGVVSKTFILKEDTKDLFSRVYVSAGLGTGRYRTENNVFTDDDTPGVFGSLALRVVDPMNVIAEWSGQDLSIGLSLRPFREIPLIFTPAITDVTGTAGDGVRFIFGVGYAITF